MLREDEMQSRIGVPARISPGENGVMGEAVALKLLCTQEPGRVGNWSPQACNEHRSRGGTWLDSE